MFYFLKSISGRPPSLSLSPSLSQKTDLSPGALGVSVCDVCCAVCVILVPVNLMDETVAGFKVVTKRLLLVVVRYSWYTLHSHHSLLVQWPTGLSY